ncbi:MAG TPA: hypothetical protein VEI83_05490 [Acidimicrobiales bacterium]|nr:hypothetical protein [Acidimicrobiales bacterium]
MAAAEEHLRREVDEVLGPVWRRERRHARRRVAWATLGRVALGMAAIWVLSVVVDLVVGVAVPWLAFGVITALATVLAFANQPHVGD